MSYYDTIEDDLARAKAILEKGKPAPWETAHFTPEVVEALREVGGGTIFGADIYAAYQLLASFVAEIERLRHALNTCEIHAHIEGIAERTACAVCLTDALAEIERLRAQLTETTP
jgi:hypothetical protein